jgi:hypothetical protein
VARSIDRSMPPLRGRPAHPLGTVARCTAPLCSQQQQQERRRLCGVGAVSCGGPGGACCGVTGCGVGDDDTPCRCAATVAAEPPAVKHRRRGNCGAWRRRAERGVCMYVCVCVLRVARTAGLCHHTTLALSGRCRKGCCCCCGGGCGGGGVGRAARDAGGARSVCVCVLRDDARALALASPLTHARLTSGQSLRASERGSPSQRRVRMRCA